MTRIADNRQRFDSLLLRSVGTKFVRITRAKNKFALYLINLRSYSIDVTVTGEVTSPKWFAMAMLDQAGCSYPGVHGCRTSVWQSIVANAMCETETGAFI